MAEADPVDVLAQAIIRTVIARFGEQERTDLDRMVKLVKSGELDAWGAASYLEPYVKPRYCRRCD